MEGRTDGETRKSLMSRGFPIAHVLQRKGTMKCTRCRSSDNWEYKGLAGDGKHIYQCMACMNVVTEDPHNMDQVKGE